MLLHSEALSIEGIVHGTHELSGGGGAVPGFGAGKAARDRVAEEREGGRCLQLPEGELP